MFPRVNLSGWGLHSKITSAQANQLDIDHANPWELYGARSIAAAYTLDAGGNDHVLLVAGGVTVSLIASTAPAAGAGCRVVRIKNVGGPSGTVTIAPNGTDTIEGLNVSYLLTQTGSEITLMSLPAGGGWDVIARGHNVASQSWNATTASAWTAPAGCYFIEIELAGGGGGGAGGTSGTTATSQSASGGGGGGGAPLVRCRVPVVPGQAYDVGIGAGGNGGAAGAPGSDGGGSYFRPHAGSNIAYGPGGGGALQPAAVTGAAALSPGGTVASSSANGTGYSSTIQNVAMGAGGFGVNNISGLIASGGSAAPEGSVSGAGLNGGTSNINGSNSGTSFGGGGGGGGGGGPYGNGATAGAGGSGNNSGAGVGGNTGANAAANTGAGGAGGGGGGCGSGSGGAGGPGGNGGSGKVTIWWIE